MNTEYYLRQFRYYSGLLEDLLEENAVDFYEKNGKKIDVDPYVGGDISVIACIFLEQTTSKTITARSSSRRVSEKCAKYVEIKQFALKSALAYKAYTQSFEKG